jgi:hypothetical protein
MPGQRIRHRRTLRIESALCLHTPAALKKPTSEPAASQEVATPWETVDDAAVEILFGDRDGIAHQHS